MRTYISLFRVRFINGLQYRVAALGGMSTQLFWGLMLVFIYQAFYQSSSGADAFSYSELVTYIWMQQAFLSFIFLYDWDGELLDMILNGGISYELCRPVNLYLIWYVKLLSKRVSRAAMRFLPIIVIAAVMPAPYNLSAPQSPAAFLLFLVTLFMGAFLLVAISMLVYISIFKTMSPIGSIGILGVVGEFFSGHTIPIPLMPTWLQDVCMVLPFRLVSDMPFRVYSGGIGVSEALQGMVFQLTWIAVLVLAGAFIMKRITRLSVVQGG